MKNQDTMPVTVITGFLGAGKTTFVNEILRNNENANFLIIENEAGNINIDRELLKNKGRGKVFEMTGGCICCSLSTELGTVLNSLIMSRVKYDYVLIEATGMADAGPIINMFSGARVQRYFRLDSVIALIDAVSFLKRLPSFNEVRKQVAQSDLILINKSDLVQTERIQQLEQKIASINPLARVKQTTYGNVDDIQILNTESFTPTKVEESITDFTQFTFVPQDVELAHSIQTLSYVIPNNFDMKKVAVWFEKFLSENSDNILRIKAILSIADLTSKIILQSVGDDFHTSEGNRWAENENRESKVVFIGTKLKEDEIKESLHALLV